MKRSELDAEVVGEARKDVKEFPPAELWTMLLHASRNFSPGG